MDWAPFYDSEIDYYIPAEPRHPDVEQLLPHREPDPQPDAQPDPQPDPQPNPQPKVILPPLPKKDAKVEIYEELCELVKTQRDLTFYIGEIYQKIKNRIPVQDHLELWYELLQIPLKVQRGNAGFYDTLEYPIKALSYLLLDKLEVTKFIVSDPNYKHTNFIKALAGILPNVEGFMNVYNSIKFDRMKTKIITYLLNEFQDAKSVIPVIPFIRNDIKKYKHIPSIFKFVQSNNIDEKCYHIEQVISTLNYDDLYTQVLEKDYRGMFKFLRLYYPFDLEKHFFRIKHNFVNDRYDIIRELLPLPPKLALNLLCSEPYNKETIKRQSNRDLFHTLLDTVWAILNPRVEESLYKIMFDVGIFIKPYGLLLPIIKRGKIRDLSKYKKLILDDYETSAYMLNDLEIFDLTDSIFNIHNFNVMHFRGVTNPESLFYMMEQYFIEGLYSAPYDRVPIERIPVERAPSGYRDASHTFKIFKNFIEMKPYSIQCSEILSRDSLGLQFVLSIGIGLSSQFKNYDFEIQQYVWKNYFIRAIKFEFIVY